MKRIDFEAHFYTEEYIDVMSNTSGYPKFTNMSDSQKRRLWYSADIEQPFGDRLLTDLSDLGEKRIAMMDQMGIDIQILSLSAPGIEQLSAKIGPDLAKKSNDTLSTVIKQHPDRFLGYAALYPKNPEEAADELERAVKELGFVGWNTHSNFGDKYLDDAIFLPILERAEKLGVPVYLHPTVPAISQLTNYGFSLAGAPFGFGLETALCFMRLLYSGVFDRFPKLKIILGHLGEALPFILNRIDWAYVRPFDPSIRPKLLKKPSEYIKNNVFVTTSGNYFKPAFMCTYEALGIDRILLGTDHPYEDMDECIDFIEGLPISKDDKDKIYYKNAKKVGIDF